MLLSDPLASPWLPTVGATLAGLLGSALLALLVSAHGQWRALRASSLFVRWRTWLVIAPLFTLVVLAGPLAVAVFAGALAVQGGREYAALAGLDRLDRGVLLIGCCLVPVLSLWLPIGLVVVVLPLLASLPAVLNQDASHGFERAARLLFGLGYLAVGLSLLVRLDVAPNAGSGVLLAVALAVALSDVGAFCVGRRLGRRLLAPRLSPSKTWAGVVGNLLGAALGLLLLAPLLPTGVPLPLLVLVVAGGAMWGDLLESMLKRSAHVKDSAAWLPGFGGLLDRIDSLLIVLPLSYVLLGALA